MSRSVHATRSEFRKAFRFDYSSDEERTRVLGKILDKKLLKWAIKLNVRAKKKSDTADRKTKRVYSEEYSALSRKTPPTEEAKEMVRKHNKKGYG